MSRKTKFTPEEKEQAVIDYLDGNKSRAQICAELSISSRTIQDWAAIYNKHGVAGFLKKIRNSSSEAIKTPIDAIRAISGTRFSNGL